MTTSTFFPDNNPETTSCDGNSSNATDGTWAQLVAGNGTATKTTSTTLPTKCDAADGDTDQWTKFWRTMITFDTSAMGAGATIDSGTIDLVCISVGDDAQTAESLVVTNSNPATNTELVAADYQAIGGTRQITADEALADLTFNGTDYTVMTLNAAGEATVDVEGVCAFGIRISGDVDDETPGWVDGEVVGVLWRSAEQSGTAKDPRLVITFTEAPSGPTVMQASGVI